MKTKTILCASITTVIGALIFLSSCFHQHSGINKVNPAFGGKRTGTEKGPSTGTGTEKRQGPGPGAWVKFMNKLTGINKKKKEAKKKKDYILHRYKG